MKIMRVGKQFLELDFYKSKNIDMNFYISITISILAVAMTTFLFFKAVS